MGWMWANSRPIMNASPPGSANARRASSSTMGDPGFWSSCVCGLVGVVSGRGPSLRGSSWPLTSESDRRAALEAERLARLVWGGRLAVEVVGQRDRLLYQFGVGLGPLAAADAEVVLEAHAHVTAEHQAHRSEVVLRRVADASG